MTRKVKSPTGKPSKVSKSNKDAMKRFMAGKKTGGKRTSTYKVPNISKPISPGVALGSGGLARVGEALAKKKRPRRNKR